MKRGLIAAGLGLAGVALAVGIALGALRLAETGIDDPPSGVVRPANLGSTTVPRSRPRPTTVTTTHEDATAGPPRVSGRPPPPPGGGEDADSRSGRRDGVRSGSVPVSAAPLPGPPPVAPAGTAGDDVSTAEEPSGGGGGTDDTSGKGSGGGHGGGSDDD